MKPPPRSTVPTSPVQLRSAGYGEFRVTAHEFVRYQEIELDQLKFSGEHGPRGVVDGRKPRALIYRCNETGAERRWGLE